MVRLPVLVLLVVALAAGVFVGSGRSAVKAPVTAPSTPTIVDAAQDFIALLGSEERALAVWEFGDEERFNWHFVPRARNGLPIRDMTSEQRAAAHALLGATLSSQGYNKAIGVMRLEELLGQLEGRPERRDPEGYFFWIFGTPSEDDPWGWRFEGHHISMNFTSASGLTVSTPSFIGTNPARVADGPYAGWRVLGAEEDAARALLASFDSDQLATALIAEEAPSDIITGADREISLQTLEGLPARAMDSAQKALLLRIVREYVETASDEIASAQMAKIEAAGIDELHFAWAGSTDPSEGHYYRVHGPTVLIEYDNTQGNVNHVHSTLRDLTDDFGTDLLRRHYDEVEHLPDGSHARGSGSR